MTEQMIWSTHGMDRTATRTVKSLFGVERTSLQQKQHA